MTTRLSDHQTTTLFDRFVEPAVDLRDFLHPLLSFMVLHVQYVVVRPVEVVGNVGYLLVQAVEGVAGYSPSDARSSSISC